MIFTVAPTSAINATAPWEGAGIEIPPDALTAEDAIKAAGLDWEVQLHRVLVDIDGFTTEFPGKRAIVRDTVRGMSDSQRFFAVVSQYYQPLQNRDAFEFFDNIVRKGEAMYHKAGFLQNGRIVFILAKLPAGITVVQDDLIEQYILLTNGHDGVRKVRMGYMPFSTAHKTVMHSALPSSKFNVGIRHMGTNFDGRVVEARRALGIISSWSTSTADAYAAMVGKRISPSAMDEYLKALYPDIDDTDYAARDARENIRQIASNGSLQGTVWNLYQATLEHIDWGNKTRTPNTRLNNIWFGTKARIKDKATMLAKKLSR